MMAYSMSKPLTAAAVLQLIEAERLSLDESINRFVTCCPYGPEISIRRLLAHSSGIPNPIPLRWVHPPAVHDTFDEHAALLTMLQRHKRLSFAPGTQYGYSNIGYWLLGEFVQRVSGMAFSSYMTSRVLQPLGLTPLELGYKIPSLTDHACGYLEKYSFMNIFKAMLIDRQFIGRYHGRWLEIYAHYLDGAAFGGLVGTAGAFGKFLQDQLRPQSALFGDSTRSQFFTQQQATDGSAIRTTLGWHVGIRKGESFYYKEGGGGGFHCIMRLHPRHQFGTVVMTNATAFNVRGLLDKIECALLESEAALRVGVSISSS
jgi:CubicO group peptidase (beta-lactamase class C family)